MDQNTVIGKLHFDALLYFTTASLQGRFFVFWGSDVRHLVDIVDEGLDWTGFCPVACRSQYHSCEDGTEITMLSYGIIDWSPTSFAFLQHVPSTLRLNGTPLIQNTLRDEHGAFKKVIIFRHRRRVLTDLTNTGP